MNENGEWVCFENHSSDSKWFCSITAHLTESSEITKTYKLETRADAVSNLNQLSWDDTYKQLDLAHGKLQSICDDEQDMLLITYEDGMQIDVGYIEEDKTYYITVVKDDTMKSWNHPLGIFSTNDKSKLPTELQKAIQKFRNT